MKRYKDLQLVDNFMFCKVFGNHPELCKGLLERIIGVPIREVVIQNPEKVIDMTPDGKSIRMDVYVNDEEGTVYNIEMQTSSKRDLGRRSRYYHGMIDLNHLEKGEKYSKLPTSFVIFICTFDYFGAGLPIYRFEKRCEEQPYLRLGDDAVTIFVNLTADFSGLSEETMVLLRYMTGQEPEDAFTEACEAIIRKARENTAWEVEYMQWHANEMDMADDLDEARAEGRAEGIEQGIELGIEQGIELGIEQGIKTGIEQGIKTGIEQGIKTGIEQGIKTGIEQGIKTGIEQGIKTGIEQGKTESVIVLKEIMYRLRKGETAEKMREEYDLELVEAALEMIRG